jgi:hypothetical protein
MFVGVKENKDCRKQYNQELMQMFGELDIPLFIRRTWLNWIGHFNRMGSKRKISQIFNNNNSQKS